MQCKSNKGECTLELKFFENGDILEFCTFCDFSYLHKDENIKDNHLNPYKKQN